MGNDLNSQLLGILIGAIAGVLTSVIGYTLFNIVSSVYALIKLKIYNNLYHKARIILLKQFALYPQGLTREDGPYSAEVFRDAVLVPALYKGNVVLNIDETHGIASSWMKEVFGGLIAKRGFDFFWIYKNLTIVSNEDPSLIIEIWEYINLAHTERVAQW